MKKILVLLLWIFLIGTMPKTDWDKGTPEQQKDFLQRLTQIVGDNANCSEGTLYAVEKADKVMFYFNCDVPNGTPIGGRNGTRM